MNQGYLCDLADCSEFRQTIELRPPVLVHAAAVLATLLVVAALCWATIVDACIVVRTPGRVRPVEQPVRVFAESGTHIDGHVAEVFVEEGMHVVKDQVLLRLDTQRLDIEMSKLRRTISATEEELAEFARIGRLLTEQFRGAKAKALAELAKADEGLERAKLEQTSRIRGARAELTLAEDRLTRQRQLVAARVVTQADFLESQSQVRQAQEKLKQAQLPLDKAHVNVLRRALEQVDKDFAVRQAELDAEQVAKRAKADAARKELDNLQIEFDRSNLRSPVGGVVVSGRVKPGDVLELGKSVFEIARQEGFHFEAAIDSRDVGRLAVGMPAKIKFDAFDFQRYGTLAGTLLFIAPDSRVMSDGGRNSSPVTYLVRIKLHSGRLCRGELHGDVKLGLGGTAEIITERQSLLMILVKKLRGTISLG
jgi:multidrug resistance efflux pump